MTYIYDLYSVPSHNLELGVQIVNELLGVAMVARDSSYSGEYYHLREADGGELTLSANFDARENEWAEEEHKDCPLLLYVNESPRADHIRLVLENGGVRFLKREVLEE